MQEERRLLRHELRTLRDEYENQRTMYDSHLSEAQVHFFDARFFFVEHFAFLQEMLRQKQRTHDKELNDLNAKMAELITKSAKAKADPSQVRLFFLHSVICYYSFPLRYFVV